MESTNNREGAPVVVSEKQREYLNVRGGSLGFHYTENKGLPGALQHGLLSRMEERKRGLSTRIRASRSIPNAIYFTTRINDLYFRGDENASLDENLKEVVGIAIDRPDYAWKKEGHFAEEDFVGPEKFKALVFIDRRSFHKDPHEQLDAHDTYKFGDPLSEEDINTRVESLIKICQEAGLDIPIYGVSGDIYWPERKSRDEIRRMSFEEPAVTREK